MIELKSNGDVICSKCQQLIAIEVWKCDNLKFPLHYCLFNHIKNGCLNNKLPVVFECDMNVMWNWIV